MACLEEHIPVGDDNDCCRQDRYNCLDAFCLRRHRDFFLHEVYEQMIDHAGEDRAVADEVYPCDDKSERNAADKEIDNV